MADTLAQLVRSKYPGSYTDISDEELEAKIEEKYPGAYSEVPRTKATQAKEETPFPTPGETAGRMVMGGLKAIPSMVKGTAQAALEFGRWGVGLGPSEEAAAEMQRHIAAATAPGADLTTRAAEGFQALPMVGPMVAGVVKGGQEIVAPLAKTMVSGVGTVTPEEMNTAADTGGAAIAGLALPELAKGVPAVAGKITPAVAGKVLKFAAKGAAHYVPGAKAIMGIGETLDLVKKMGTIATDQYIAAVAKGDVAAASKVVARGMEQNPELAAKIADAIKEQQTRMAESAKATGMNPPTFSPTDGSPAAVAARNAAKRARLGRTPTDTSPVAPAQPSATQDWTPESARAALDHMDALTKARMIREGGATLGGEAAGVQAPVDPRTAGYPRGAPVNPGPWEAVDPLPERVRAQVPVPGNVKPATVYTKPGPKVKPPAGESEAAKALAKKQGEVASPDAIRAAFGETPKGSPHGKKGPSGAPLTAAERREALIRLQQTIASGEDIFASFGITPSR